MAAKIRTVNNIKVETLKALWLGAGYILGKVIVYQDGKKTIALSTKVDSVIEYPIQMMPSSLASKQNWYVFFVDSEDIYGNLFFYNRTRINRLQKNCIKEAERVETSGDFLQENTKIMHHHSALKQVGRDLLEVRINIGTQNYNEAYLYLRDAVSQFDIMKKYEQGHSEGIPVEISDEFMTMIRALDSLVEVNRKGKIIW